ncbi:MAG: hypothetical protein U1E77_09705 [Inhella sp.]
MYSTLALAVAAYNLPSHLPKTWLPTEEVQIFLIQLLLSVATLFLGTLVTLFFVVVEHRNQTKKLKQTQDAFSELLLQNVANLKASQICSESKAIIQPASTHPQRGLLG